MKCIIPLLVLLVLVGCATSPSAPLQNETKSSGVSDVSFVTEDGVTIYATLYTPERWNAKTIVALPMLDHTRDTYASFAFSMMSKGYKVLALDLRGHGESVSKDGEDYVWKDFMEEDFKNMVLDVKAAHVYLGSSEFALVGASIGANTALQYAVSDADVTSLVLLSPGENYRGVTTLDAAEQYVDRPVLIVVTSGDKNSLVSSSKIYSAFPSEGLKTLEAIREGSSHGTDMFSETSTAFALVSDFILQTY